MGAKNTRLPLWKPGIAYVLNSFKFNYKIKVFRANAAVFHRNVYANAVFHNVRAVVEL